MNNGPMMNKRALFKTVGGAVAAATMARGGPEAQRQLNYPVPPTSIYPDQMNAANGLLGGMPDVTYMAKQAMMARAQEEANKQEAMLNRRRAALHRMKSVSTAYIDYQMTLFQKEQHAIWNRVEEARQFIFG